MNEQVKLNKPWMVAVWPGMGHVAMSAGYYLMAKLEMHLLAEFRALELFDVEHVEVKGAWSTPAGSPAAGCSSGTTRRANTTLWSSLARRSRPWASMPFATG